MTDKPELPEQIQRRYVSRAPKPATPAAGPNVHELPLRLRLAWYESHAEAMTDRLKAVPRFGIVSDEPMGPNPFPESDSRRGVFEKASRLTQEHLSAFAAAMLGRVPARDAEPDERQTWRVEAAAGQFAIKVWAVLSVFATSRESLTDCKRMIDYLADHALETLRAGPVFVSMLRTKMLEYREYLVGQAYRLLGATASEAETPPKPAAVSPKVDGPARDRAYRDEIQAWIAAKGFDRQVDAAKHLGVGLDTLKAIMRGASERYSPETRRSVLKKIGAAE